MCKSLPSQLIAKKKLLSFVLGRENKNIDLTFPILMELLTGVSNDVYCLTFAFIIALRKLYFNHITEKHRNKTV